MRTELTHHANMDRDFFCFRQPYSLAQVGKRVVNAFPGGGRASNPKRVARDCHVQAVQPIGR
jgi:hypothetical protein